MREYNFIMGEFDESNVLQFVEFMNNYASKEDFHLKLHMDSAGGRTYCKDIFCKILNDYSHEVHVLRAQSAAFESLVDLRGRVSFYFNAYGMYHRGKCCIEYREGMIKTPATSHQEKMNNKESQRTDLIVNRLDFYESEKNKILKGEDVYFEEHRMKELFAYKLIS